MYTPGCVSELIQYDAMHNTVLCKSYTAALLTKRVAKRPKPPKPPKGVECGDVKPSKDGKAKAPTIVEANPILCHHPRLPCLTDIEFMRDSVKTFIGRHVKPPKPHDPSSLWTNNMLGKEAWAKPFYSMCFPYLEFTTREFYSCQDLLFVANLYKYHLLEN